MRKPSNKLTVIGLRGVPGVEGGIETHCEHLYPMLVKHGFDIEILCRSRYVAQVHASTWNDIRLTKIWSPKHPALETIVHTLIGILYCAWKRPGIVHLHGVGPAIWTPLARLFGLKVVVTHHGFDYEREKWSAFAKAVLKLGERFGATYANALIVISKVIRDRIESDYAVRPHVIPNGVQVPENRCGPKPGTSKGKYFLMVGRFVPEKRIEDGIRAFAAADLDGFRFVVAGNKNGADKYSEKIRLLAEQSNSVELLGFQSREQLSALYAGATAVILPSSHEGLPLVLLEALSNGTRVIVSDIDAHLEVDLSPESYFPLRDINALSEKMERATVNNWQLADRLEQQAWIKERYSWEKITRRTIEAYSTVIEMPALGAAGKENLE